MSCVAVGIIGGSAIVGGLISSSGAKSAAKTQAEAADNATALQKEMYYNNIELQKPWYEMGTAALSRLGELTGITPTASNLSQSYNPTITLGDATSITLEEAKKTLAASESDPTLMKLLQGGGGSIGWALSRSYNSLKDEVAKAEANAPKPQSNALLPTGGSSPEEIMKLDPGYQFRLDEGTRGADASAAARGGALGGAQAKALERYRQNYASNEYQNVWNRLSSIAGIGQSASNAMSASGQNYANSAGDLMTQAGNARASGYVGSANAWSGAVNNIGTNLLDVWNSSRQG